MTETKHKLLDDLVGIVVKEGASDLHLSEGRPPTIRVSGFLIPLLKVPILTKGDMETLKEVLLSPENKAEFEERKEVNFAYSHASIHRFRANMFLSMGQISVAMRLVPSDIKTFAELNLPPILEIFARKQQGFFIVVGPAGQGKSTTLATMIETINQERLEHIITIEDPVEYVF